MLNGKEKQKYTSKQWLVEALLSLMKTKYFEEIKIQEIARTAQLDRRTFYRHFSNKREVLSYYLDCLMEEHLAQFDDSEELNFANLEQHLTFVFAHKDFLSLMNQQQLSDMVLHKYIECMMSIESELINQDNHLMIMFKTGGFWNVILYWLEEEPEITPKELSVLLQNFIQKGLIMKEEKVGNQNEG